MSNHAVAGIAMKWKQSAVSEAPLDAGRAKAFTAPAGHGAQWYVPLDAQSGHPVQGGTLRVRPKIN